MVRKQMGILCNVTVMLGLLFHCAWVQASTVVLNEIFYHPVEDCEPLEFIELYNPAEEAIDVSGWFLRGAVRFTFPDEASIAPGGYALIAQDADAFRNAFPGIASPVWGDFEGELNNRGEWLELLDHNRNPVDRVEYSETPPWPAYADGLGASLELRHPSLDNARATSWGGSTDAQAPYDTMAQFRYDSLRITATPGEPNSLLTGTLPPLILTPTHQPASPTATDPVIVTAEVLHAETVTLEVQVVPAGEFISLDDREFLRRWQSVPMTALDDNRYKTTIEAHPHRTLVRYRLRAVSADGEETLLPAETEPTPNFAWFVYDGVPPYRATNPVERTHTVLEKVPVYHLISDADDIHQCQHQNLNGSNVMRREFRWYGAFVYNGRVYDHIRYRLRGGVWRYSFNKRMWKIRFNKGNYFEGHHNDGTPYLLPRRTLNLSSITQNMRVHTPRRGELGLFETSAFWLFRKAGVPGAHTTWVHFRIVDEADEHGRDQYSGDFFGLYLSLEQMDDRFLETHGFEEGSALYKMNRGWTVDGKRWERESNHCDPRDDSDIQQFYQGFQRGGLTYLEQHVDLDSYLSYRTILEAIHHYDVYAEKNYYYSRNEQTGLWEMLPWDVDLTFGADHGSGREPFRDLVVGDLSRRGTPPDAPYSTAYRNRMREIIQLLYNEEVFFPVLDEWAALIREIAAADLDRWDLFQPLDATPSKSRYETLDFRLNQMKDWIRQRLHESYIDNGNSGQYFIRALYEMVEDAGIPETPSIISHENEVEMAATSVSFESSAYIDPDEDMHLASQWILTPEGELEIEPVWDSGETQQARTHITLNLAQFAAGDYRLRVRHKDLSGRWSWYSEPLRFTILEPVAVTDWALFDH